MLIPLLSLLVALSVALLAVGILKKSRRILAGLVISWWICSLASAFFIGWAWSERSYSENWAMYGVLFISLPIIVAVGVLATAAVIAAKLRKIENMKKIAVALYLLLLFLAAQVGIGLWAA
jgi:hypothetical protein